MAKAQSVRLDHSTVIVMDNTMTSSLASLLAGLEQIIQKCENQEFYPLAINHKADLLLLRKEVFGY